MRVILQAAAGPESGRRLALDAGESLSVGRTERADVALANDAALSSLHFLVQTDGAGCAIEDLQSRNGTFVNGRRIVERTPLQSGDQVLAGQTTFVVEFIDAPGPKSVAQASVAAGPSSPKTSYTVEPCDSGLTLCRGSLDEIQPADVALRLAGVLPAHLIVDFHHLGTAPPEGLSTRNYLFDWLDADAAAAASPLVVSQGEFPDWPALVAQGWGKNAVVCLFAGMDRASLLAHLRGACRGRRGDGEGLVGWCWPSVLALLLSHGPAAAVEALLSGIDAALVELPDLPQTWQLFGRERLPETLDRLGFARATD
jgi:hypothetical protein